MAGTGRERWTSKSGFILAAVGSAVGLGNMWRFSYLAAENGGAAFVVLYLALTLIVGLPVMLAELTLGRGAGKSPLQALGHYGGSGWKPLGGLFIAAGFLILGYYSVIAGWTLRYAIEALVTGFSGDAGERFSAIASGPAAVAWHVGFMVVTVAVVARGVSGGIERLAQILMPALFAVLIGLALYASTLEGGGDGYRHYLSFDLSEVMRMDVFTEAAGQAFFSLSLGMGAMLTFASYMDRSHDLPQESGIIAAADFGVAFVAGLVVFPVIFALGMQEQVGGSTVGALFITLPTAFHHMGAAGTVVGIIFFGALVVGALTSAISLLEVVVSSGMDAFGWPRARATWIFGGAIALVGIPAALDTDLLGLMDQVAGNVLLVFGGLLLSIFVGWVMEDPIGEVAHGTSGIRWFGLWRTLLRYVVPVLLGIVLWNSLGATWTALVGYFGS